MDIKIRSSTLNDLKKYTNLLQLTYQTAYTNESLGLKKECFSKEIFNTPDTQEYLKNNLINNERQKAWLAFYKDDLVGSITIKNKEKEFELTGFYVHPNHQGKGIGKKLFKLASDYSGKNDIVLDIYEHNLNVIKMYKKWGFKLDQTKGENGVFYRHWPEWPDGLKAKCIYMKLNKKL